jgi:hypothetical protein
MTPETDKQAISVIGFYSCATVPADFARRLERERDEARDTVLRLRKQRAIARNFGDQMERERDEARRLIADAKESLNAIHVEVGGWISSMMKGAK